jgi:hypothetical protein
MRVGLENWFYSAKKAHNGLPITKLNAAWIIIYGTKLWLQEICSQWNFVTYSTDLNRLLEKICEFFPLVQSFEWWAALECYIQLAILTLASKKWELGGVISLVFIIRDIITWHRGQLQMAIWVERQLLESHIKNVNNWLDRIAKAIASVMRWMCDSE